MERKAGMGSVAFHMQIQNEIISSENNPIKKEWLEASISNYKMVTPPYRTFIGVDLASKGNDSDFFTISVVLEKDYKIYLVDGVRTKASLHKQLELIKSMDFKWKPNKIGIEQAAQQKIIIDEWMDTTTLPIIPVKPSIVNDRISRVDRLSVLFETGRIFVNPQLTNWVDECAVFPNGAHDDCIDSLSYAIQASQDGIEEQTDWRSVAEMVHTVGKKTRTADVSHKYKLYRV